MRNFLKIYKKLKVKSKIIIVLLAVAYISIILVSAISYIGGRDFISKRISIEIDLTAQNISQSTNRLIYERFNDLQNLISNPILASNDSTTKEKTDELNNSLIKLGWYNNLHLADTEGVVIASTQNSAISKNISDTAWYKKNQRDFISVSDVLSSPFTNSKVLIFSNTLIDENNNNLGTIFAEFSWQVIQDVLKQSPDDIQVYLFSKNGDIIAEKGIEDVNGLTSKEDLENDKITKNFFTTQVVSEGYLGFDGNGWSFIVQMPKVIAYQPLVSFSNILLLAVIAISLLVYIIGYQTANTLVRPIQILTKGVKKFTKGNLEQHIEVNSEDEIGFLADNFNEMSQTLLQKTNFLREEKGKYKSILDSANEGIILIDLKGNVIAHNNKSKKILNLNKKKLIGLKAKEVFRFLDQKENIVENKRQFTAIQKILNHKNPKNNHNFIITLEKPKYKILNIFTTHVTTEDKQNTLGRIWIFQDVTKERSADKLKSDFIKVISHKLRTPLTVIEWTTQLLSNAMIGKMNAEQKEAIEQITLNTDRLNYLINMLINAAEIQKRTLKTNFEKFNIIETINEVSTKIMRLSSKKNNKIKINIANKAKEILVKADAYKIKQVLTILLENATTYTKDKTKNTVNIDVSINKKAEKVTLSISDQGIGIEGKEQDEIFSKFFRGEKSFAKHPDGAGLGLYLAKVIIDSHRQKISFASSPDGTTFTITLKLVKKN